MRARKLKNTCIFLSAHLDDAVLSCGGLISSLAGKRKKIIVATIFTKAIKGKNSGFTKEFLNNCGFSDETLFFKKRLKEDKEAVKYLGGEVMHLGFVDAAWRQKPKLSKFERLTSNFYPGATFLYPRDKVVFSVNIVDSKAFLKKIKNKVEGLLNREKQSSLFVPLGIGKHVDHIITRKLGESLTGNLFYYEDFPYNYDFISEKRKKETVNEVINSLELCLSFEYVDSFRKKIKSIKLYPDSSALFSGNKIPKVPERYYQKCNHL